MAAKKPPEPPNRSGTQWGDADYAAHGYGRITLRLPIDALELLAREAERSDRTRARVIDDLIRAHCRGSG